MPENGNEFKGEVSLAIIGSGGAGVMTTGELLLSGASRCGQYGILTKSFGPQIRGGESACFLRLGDHPFEKQAEGIDLLVAFDWRNTGRFLDELSLNPDAWVFSEEAEGEVPFENLKAKNWRSVGWKQLAGRIEGVKGRPNIFVLGMLFHLLGMKQGVAFKALEDRFGDKGSGVLEGNQKSFQAGWNWADAEWNKELFNLKAHETGVSNRWVLTGNQGIVIGSLAAGCEFFAGYPITPATDIMEELSHYLPQRGGVLIQAEDELAAVNMAIGASFGGKKAITATSGPGFSLMGEGLGLALMAEIPLVVVDVQRGGPSTGIPTKTEQSDLWAAIASSHGDNPRVVIAPSTIQGCIEKTVKAFNISETYQVPVILVSDQFLGGRMETVDPISVTSFEVKNRPTVVEVGIPSDQRFGENQGDVFPITIPGMVGGEQTADGLEHNDHGWPDDSHKTHQLQSERRLRKLDPLVREEGWIEVCGEAKAPVAVIGWGSTGGVIRETVKTAQKRGQLIKGIIPHLLLPPQVTLLNQVLGSVEVLFVAELSSMKQFLHYLRSFCQLPPKVVSISRAGGRPFRTSEVLSSLTSMDEKKEKA